MYNVTGKCFAHIFALIVALNHPCAPLLWFCFFDAGHAIKSAIEKAGIDKALVDDVILGCGMPEGETGMNVARNAALWCVPHVPCPALLLELRHLICLSNLCAFSVSLSLCLSVQ
jgi:hypothetical protein